jgi:hypothetical protein
LRIGVKSRGNPIQVHVLAQMGDTLLAGVSAETSLSPLDG